MANLFSEKPIVKVVMLKGQDGKDGKDKLINQADGSGLSFWVGTKAEYDAIPEAELITNCVYYITDDTRDDFNTRLNQLDTAVDNNTTAIADNTANIESNTADIAANTADIAANTAAIADNSTDINTINTTLSNYEKVLWSGSAVGGNTATISGMSKYSVFALDIQMSSSYASTMTTLIAAKRSITDTQYVIDGYISKLPTTENPPPTPLHIWCLIEGTNDAITIRYVYGGGTPTQITPPADNAILRKITGII